MEDWSDLLAIVVGGLVGTAIWAAILCWLFFGWGMFLTIWPILFGLVSMAIVGVAKEYVKEDHDA